MLCPKPSAANGFDCFVLVLHSDLKPVKLTHAFMGTKKKKVLSEGRKKKISVYNFFVLAIFFPFLFFSSFWKDAEKVTAELQEKGAPRSAIQATFKATFQDKKIKHNQRQQFFFLLPERPCKISALRRMGGYPTS